MVAEGERGFGQSRWRRECDLPNRSVVLPDFGKVKSFLDEHGPTPQAVVSQHTGVSLDKIESCLKKGMVEISNGSRFFLNCEKCGCEIRYGRYCSECASEEMRRGYQTSYQDIGERPKQNVNPEMAGKMHFLNRKNR